MEKRKCVFAGSFDPPTLGHKATIEDCLRLFDEVVVAVMVNPKKQPCFTAKERMEMLSMMFPNESRIKILEYAGTAVDLLKQEGTNIYVRGIRNGIDLDYENADFYASQTFNKDLLTVYLPCRQELLHVSSSILRNCLTFGKPIEEYVTKEVEEYIKHKEKMKKE